MIEYFLLTSCLNRQTSAESTTHCCEARIASCLLVTINLIGRFPHQYPIGKFFSKNLSFPYPHMLNHVRLVLYRTSTNEISRCITFEIIFVKHATKLKKKLKLPEDQSTLKSMGFAKSQPLSPGQTDSEPATSNVSNDAMNQAKSPPVPTPAVPNRKFQEKWISLYLWLVYDAENNIMKCSVCRNAKKTNSFTNFRTNSIIDHIKIMDHKAAILVPKLQDNLKDCISLFCFKCLI